MENEIILFQPTNKLGVLVKNLLKTAKINFTINLKEPDSEVRLFSGESSYKGLKEIKAFISLEKSKTKK